MNSKKVAFIGWNPFQLRHVRNIIKAIPGSIFILESRKDYIDKFSYELLNDRDVPVTVFKPADIPKIDGLIDVLICQTLFPGIEKFEKTTIATLQYGYAKEAHNYGTWRSIGDLFLAYGKYAADKVSPFCHSVPLGNPRWDDWQDESWRERARSKFSGLIDPSRATVVYAPTWGDISSSDAFLDAVCKLAERFNVVIKMHHNTDLLEAARSKQIRGKSELIILGANDDLFEALTVADAFISDYSGAIFDAMLVEVPIVLLGSKGDATLGPKVDSYSIEYALRDELGVIAAAPSDVVSSVDKAVNERESIVSSVAPLRSRLFNIKKGVSSRISSEILNLMDGRYKSEQYQSYIRNDCKDLIRTKAELRRLKNEAAKVAPSAGKKA